MSTLNRKYLEDNINNLQSASCATIEKYPEKVIQFGEGNFLRAFVDWQINKLNSKNLFNGSIVVVQPIENGMVDILNTQDGVYTSLQRGIINGELVENSEIITSISRGINPYKDWQSYLDLAHNNSIKYIVSNTTEAGIAYSKSEFDMNSCPVSYPAKLTMLLFERYKCFEGSTDSGFVLIPCELIERNGTQLRGCVLRHADDWNLGEDFKIWIQKSNYFCNTLVDRIVPGYPKDEISILEKKFGYKDNLLVNSEIFHLWVIEGDKKIKEALPFTKAGLNVVWTDDLAPYRTLKVRILNGLHTTFTIPSIFLGNETVKQSMDDSLINKMIQTALYKEIVPNLDFTESEIDKYASAVLERFRNPFIKHYLLSITLNSISKFKVRVLPSILKYFETNGKLPVVTVFSLAALIRFYLGKMNNEGKYICTFNEKLYPVNDEPDIIEYFSTRSTPDFNSVKLFVKKLLSIEKFWGTDLTKITGMTDDVIKYLELIENNRFDIALQKVLEKN
jgi:tagaturonate reductase